jgi:HEAT repeat protein
MLATGDLGLLPEDELHRRAQSGPLYELKDNPLPALLEATRRANAMQPANVPGLVKLLENEDAALRWWGALGLVALSTEAKSAEPGLRKALADPSPEVRIAAAEAIGNLGDDAAALEVLTETLHHESEFVRLAALNVLDRFGTRARPALPAIRAAALKSPGPVASYVNRMVKYMPAWIASGQREAGHE